MKKLLLTFVAMATSAMCFAQLQLATLEHEDSVSVYYGASALIEAHAAAVDGDIITLSPGMFSGGTIDKLVTIRGAGMINDTTSGTVRTMIDGNLNIGSSTITDSTHYLTLEGLYINDAIRCKKLFSPKFIKCFIRSIVPNTSGDINKGQVVNCIINSWPAHNNPVTVHVINTNFFNSVIIQLKLDGNDNISPFNTFTNCICGTENGVGHKNQVFVNCILYCNNNNSGTYSSNSTTKYISYNSDYCIGINTDTSNTYYSSPIFLDASMPVLIEHNLHNYDSLEDIFKTFNGTFVDQMSFELQDSIATTILGSDGTQVGIYGGPMPFNPYVYNHKVTAANRTTPDGFLNVEIRLNDEE